MAWEGVVQEIELSKLRPMRLPFRVNADEGIDELAASIAEQGLFHPLIVRPMDGYFEVVAGNRRLQALRMLGKRKAPCVIMELDDKRAFELALVENIQRRDLNPIEEALAFKSYIEEHGYGSESELARRIGKSQEYVSRRLQLLRLPEKVREEVMRRRIPPSTAAELVALEDPRSIEMAAELIMKGGLRREQVRQMIREAKDEPRDGPPSWRSEDPSEERVRRAERAINKYIAALKVALISMDDVLEDIRDDWLIYEILMEHRSRVHGQVDELIKLKRQLADQLVVI